MYKRLSLILIGLTACYCAWCQPLSDKARVSLLTCQPGQELYSRYGHTAFRISDPANDLDVIFNYGVFSFDTDNFYWKFVKGETYYELGIDNTDTFLWAYAFNRRAIYEQILNLTTEQKQRLFDALRVNYLPENRAYLYNFVFDNCATRAFNMLQNALGEELQSDYVGRVGQPYRQVLSHYTGKYSWEDFGINLLFGRRANLPMENDDRLFLPEELMNYVSHATFADGTPLVQRENIMAFPTRPTPWYDDCRYGLVAYALLIIGLSLYDRSRKKLTWWVDLVVGIIYAFLIGIVIFLTFFSLHPLVGFSWRLFIIPVIHLCARLIYILR
ncbi:MAG: DUF4105 domain-containing protein [Paludibacteraceae bacterium]|nr:DUF4105 domain-containing protein [Paludibacteraceae bacterium]